MKTNDKAAAIVLALFVWGLAGALFGALFSALYGLLSVLGLAGWQALVGGTAIAAVTTSAFYSAMPVALVGAMAGMLASIGTLMATGHQLRLLPLVLAAGIAGLLGGSFYSWMIRGRGRPLAVTFTGLLAGLVAGGAMAVGLAIYGADLGMPVLAAGIVALVGSLFQLSERWVVGTLCGRVPHTLSAPVVAGLVASVVGGSIWVMGGATASALDESVKLAIDQVLDRVPAGLLGGLVGGAVTGVTLELLGVRLEDHTLSA